MINDRRVALYKLAVATTCHHAIEPPSATCEAQMDFRRKGMGRTARLRQFPPAMWLILLVGVLLGGHDCHRRIGGVGVAEGRRLAGARRKRHANPLSRNIIIRNESRSKIDAFWIHPETRELAPSNFVEDGGLVYGSDGALQSYVGHSFEVVELPPEPKNKKNKVAADGDEEGRNPPKPRKCRKGMCRKAYFTVNENEDQSEYVFVCLLGRKEL